MKDATLNVRLDATLKQHGLEVLERSGVSVTDAVRGLFTYMERNQQLPEGLVDDCEREDVFERRRRIARSMVGILPADATLEEAREARLAAHGL